MKARGIVRAAIYVEAREKDFYLYFIRSTVRARGIVRAAKQGEIHNIFAFFSKVAAR